MRKEIGVAFGGPSPEHDVSILTGLQAYLELSRAGTEVSPLYWSRSGQWSLVEGHLEAEDFAAGVPRGSKPLSLVASPEGGFFLKKRRLDIDIVLNCCHGGPGEDGTLQGALALAGLPFTGPPVRAAAVGMDKLLFGYLIAAAGLPTLPRLALSPDGANVAHAPFPGPYIVKPRFGGSSIGIEVVETMADAKALAAASSHLNAGTVVEPFLLDAVDLSIAVRRYPTLESSAIERPKKTDQAVYSYREKYLHPDGMATAPRELPAQLPSPIEARLRSAALEIACLTGLGGIARVDFLLHENDLWVTEVNMIPGSLSLHLWTVMGRTRLELLKDMIQEARERGPEQFSTLGADGTALRSAASIASKLA